MGAEAQEDIKARTRRPAQPELPRQANGLVDETDAARAAAKPLGDLEQNFPIGALFGPAFEYGRTPAGDIAHGEVRQKGVEMILGHGPARWKNDIGMAGRFV